MFRSRENRDFSHICRSHFFLNPYFSVPQSESFFDVPGLKADQQMVSRRERASPAWPSLSRHSADDYLLSGTRALPAFFPCNLPDASASWKQKLGCVCVGGWICVCWREQGLSFTSSLLRIHFRGRNPKPGQVQSKQAMMYALPGKLSPSGSVLRALPLPARFPIGQVAEKAADPETDVFCWSRAPGDTGPACSM